MIDYQYAVEALAAPLQLLVGDTATARPIDAQPATGEARPNLGSYPFFISRFSGFEVDRVAAPGTQ